MSIGEYITKCDDCGHTTLNEVWQVDCPKCKSRRLKTKEIPGYLIERAQRRGDKENDMNSMEDSLRAHELETTRWNNEDHPPQYVKWDCYDE